MRGAFDSRSCATVQDMREDRRLRANFTLRRSKARHSVFRRIGSPDGGYNLRFGAGTSEREALRPEGNAPPVLSFPVCRAIGQRSASRQKLDRPKRLRFDGSFARDSGREPASAGFFAWVAGAVQRKRPPSGPTSARTSAAKDSFMFILPDNGCRDPQWRRRISVAVMADTLFSIDPWTDDFAAAFRRALLNLKVV